VDFAPHRHPHHFWEICYVLGGGGRYFIEKQSYPMGPGDVFLVNDHEIHNIVAEKTDRVTVMFSPHVLNLIPHVDGLSLRNLFVDRPPDKSHLVRLEEREKDEVEALSLLLAREYDNRDRGFWAICLGCLSAQMGIVARAYYREHTATHVFSATEQLVQEMIGVIERHVTERLSLTELAARAGVSPSYFSTVFKKVTGIPLVSFINLKRLQKAKELLRTTELKVSAVSVESGFNDLSHFNRVFKRELDVSPLRYRRLSRQ
jgi:AraC-like DNA-binding protein